MSLMLLAPRISCAVGIVLCLTASAHAQSSEYAEEMAKADAALAAGEHEDALKAYKRANSKAKNKSAEALHGVAGVYLALGSFKQAADTCKDALEHVGDNTDLAARLHNVRGVALSRLAEKPDDKRLPLAETELRRALELQPRLASVRFNLGLVLLQMERDDEGVALMREFVKLVPNAASAAEAKRMIEEPRRARVPFAPEFSVVSLDGKRLSLEGLRGKTVLIDFWGTWCPPCRAATPDLVRLAKKFADREFVIVGISSDKSAQIVTDYAAKNAMPWPQFVGRYR